MITGTVSCHEIQSLIQAGLQVVGGHDLSEEETNRLLEHKRSCSVCQKYYDVTLVATHEETRPLSHSLGHSDPDWMYLSTLM